MRIGITGISGSFGSAICEQFAKDPENAIVGIARDELKAEQIMMRYRERNDNVRVMVIAAGLSDELAMNRAFKGCGWLIHAAALKRISGSVYATEELVKTNIIGVMNILEVARKQGVEKTLLISSDKAVEATNLYGSTKFTGECLGVQSNAFIFPATGGIVSCVRWGNVLGSRGSVLHIWRKQRDANQCLTLTHERMTRFIITMPKAVAFTTRVLAAMQGGEIFVPILGAAYMKDLAYAVRDEHGPRSNDLKFIGFRPGGEKMHEMLLSQEEPSRTYQFGTDGYFIAPSHRTWSAVPYNGIPWSITAEYASNTTPLFSVGQLIEMVRGVPVSKEE